MIERRQITHYQVPRRFGLRTILVLMALFALMLSIVKWTSASLAVLMLYASFVVVVAGAQVVLDRSPRLGSIVAGAVFLPILKFVAYAIDADLAVTNTDLFTGLFAEGHLIYLLVYGGLCGYLGGTMLAGFYLVLDKIQLVAQWRYAQGRMPTEAS